MKPATFAPAYCAMYPMLVEIVRWHGYALAVHGTVQRDFDLVAIPWGIDPSPPDAVVRELVGRLDVRLIGSFEPKMHGRVACTLSVGFGECAIDLSFMPCVPVRDNLTRATPPRAEVDVAVRDVLAERDKQRAKWSSEHDDKHSDGSLSAAAAVLAHPEVDGVFGPDWAFDLRVKHDNDDRTRRVIAAALLLAEIERLDRRALSSPTPTDARDAGGV